jgi:SAM-dependent methyltransferase
MLVADGKFPDLGGNAEENSGEMINGELYYGDPMSFVPVIWRHLIRRFDVKSVLDVGCGLGYSTRWFAEQGLYTVGFDGLPYNVEHAVYPIYLHDIKNGAFVADRYFDMVWCCEVAEHIDNKYCESFLLSLCNGKLIAMTAAPPGQPGYHHVNLRPNEYWINHLIRYGYKFLEEETKICKELLSPGWFSGNGMLLIK